MEQSHTAASPEFKLEVFKENLNHLRHIENERMTFNGLFGAVAGGVLSFIVGSGNSVPIVLLLLFFLLFLNIVCLLLTEKWNVGFDSHNIMERNVYLELLGHEGLANMTEQDIRNNCDVNRYYCFDMKQFHNQYLERNEKLVKRFYIRTNTLFLVFNWLTLSAIGAAIVFTITGNYLLGGAVLVPIGFYVLLKIIFPYIGQSIVPGICYDFTHWRK